jgi:FkbM family methyltransferase
MIGFENFKSLCNYIDSHSTNEMITNIFKGQLDEFSVKIDNEIELRETFSRFFKNIGGNYKPNYFEGRINDLKKNINEYKWVYDNLLFDDVSKETYFNILSYELTGDFKHILKAYYKKSNQYFLEDIFKNNDINVFVDCGALDGKTTIEFIEYCPNYKKIYLYEPIPESYDYCVKNMNLIDCEDKIFVRNNAVFNDNCILNFVQDASNQGSSRNDCNGTIIVKATTIDKDILEPLDFIKMDIEGSEQQAIEGAKLHIKNDSPYLAICVYHCDNDLWKIPKQIIAINENYEFILRHYSAFDYSETVLYAIPKSRNNLEENYEASIRKNSVQFQSEINRMSLAQSLVKQEYETIFESKLWLYEQYYNLIKENRKCELIIEELRQWSTQLLEEKENLKKQLNIEISKPWYKKLIK